ncbi:MAG: hypothetical protein U9Q89_05120 [Thermodesulfobacteriota bacterium]|nr:hypothetical protein [Thermodesulfobacteriota bacterium]
MSIYTRDSIITKDVIGPKEFKKKLQYLFQLSVSTKLYIFQYICIGEKATTLRRNRSHSLAADRLLQGFNRGQGCT